MAFKTVGEQCAGQCLRSVVVSGIVREAHRRVELPRRRQRHRVVRKNSVLFSFGRIGAVAA